MDYSSYYIDYLFYHSTVIPFISIILMGGDKGEDWGDDPPKCEVVIFGEVVLLETCEITNRKKRNLFNVK